MALLAVIALVLVVANSGATVPPVTYRCSDGTRLVATFRGDPTALGSVVLKFARSKQQFVLPQMMSADGGRYGGDSMQFWIKGNQATLTRAGKNVGCNAA